MQFLGEVLAVNWQYLTLKRNNNNNNNNNIKYKNLRNERKSALV